MTAKDKTVSSACRLRRTGVIVLLLGLGGASLLYWQGTRARNFSDDPAMLGFNRAEERQMEILYGKQGRLVEEVSQTLKQPGTQAMLIAAVSTVIAAGCFYFARRPDNRHEPRD